MKDHNSLTHELSLHIRLLHSYVFRFRIAMCFVNFHMAVYYCCYAFASYSASSSSLPRLISLTLKNSELTSRVPSGNMSCEVSASFKSETGIIFIPHSVILVDKLVITLTRIPIKLLNKNRIRHLFNIGLIGQDLSYYSR